MPIQVLCTGCQARLKAPDTAVGKKIRCPKCQTVVGVSAAGATDAAASKSSADLGASTNKKPDQWFLQTPDGSQYGPVDRSELDQWYSEGRVSSECQLLKAGSTQWQWAAEIYPTLVGGAASASNTSLSPSTGTAYSSDPFKGQAASVSPLTPLSSASPFSDPLGSSAMSPLGTAPASTTLPSYGSSPALSSGYGQSGGGLNPYSPSTLGPGYGAYSPRTGPHPMVIVTGIFHILAGVWNFIAFIVAIFFAFIFLAGGGMAAAMGASAQEAEAQGAAGMIATLGVVGAVILFAIALLILAYSIFQISAAIGLFRRRRWAKVASFVFAGLGIVCMFFYLIGAVSFEPISILSLLFELAYVTIIFVAMCLPDATRDFR